MTDELHIPPSQQPMQGAVPKPGEPVNPTKGILAVPKAPEVKKAKAEVVESPPERKPAARKGA